MAFNFKDNETVEDLEKVPAKYQGLYTKIEEGDDEGKYKIDDSAKGIVGDFVTASKSLTGLKTDKKNAITKATSYETKVTKFKDMASEFGIELDDDFDDDDDDALPNAYKGKFDEMLNNVKQGKTFKVDLDKVNAANKKKMNEEIGKKDAVINKLQSDLRATKISDSATRAISKHKGSVELLLPLVEKQCTLVEEDGKHEVRVIDEDKNIRSNGMDGWVEIEDLVVEMKNDEKFGRAFDSEKNDPTKGLPANPGGGRKAPSMKRDEMKAVDKINAGLSDPKNFSDSGLAI